MTKRDDRLRRPPKPRTRAVGTRARLATDEKHLIARQPHERDESADSQVGGPHKVIRQAYVDLMSGLQDTDCRNRVGEILGKAARKARRPRK
jgi:hypothetical protein